MRPRADSPAVMARRHEAPDSLDHFPTPPWATRALCEWLESRSLIYLDVALDPACGTGEMVRPLREYFHRAVGSDVHDYGHADQVAVEDFLGPGPFTGFDWIITNPPFRLALPFIERALDVAEDGVAMLVRTAFLEGGERHRKLFSRRPPSHVLQFCERVPMLRGRLSGSASTATSYCWLVWKTMRLLRHPYETRLEWIPPGTRARLEMPGDYPPEPSRPAPAPLLDGEGAP